MKQTFIQGVPKKSGTINISIMYSIQNYKEFVKIPN